MFTITGPVGIWSVRPFWDVTARRPRMAVCARPRPAGNEAVVGRGDDEHGRDARSLAARHATAVGRIEGAAGVAVDGGDRQPLEVAPQPVHREAHAGDGLDQLVGGHRPELDRVSARGQRGPGGQRQHGGQQAAQDGDGGEAAHGGGEILPAPRPRRPGSPLRRMADAFSPLGSCPGRRSAAIAVGDGHAPVAPEGARGDLDARRRLAALVLRQVDESDDPLDVLGGKALGDELLAALV